MNFTYENQGANTYLVYTVAPTDTVDEISLGMLTNNHIPALLPTTFTQMDAERRIRYNVTTKISAKEFLLGLVNAKRLCGVFLGVTEAFLAAEEYMLEWSSLLLDTEYIFSDVTTSETQMLCFPVQREAAPVDPKAFFKTVLSGIQCDQTESTDYYARIMTYLNSPTFSLAEFKGLLEDILATRGVAPAPKVAPAPQPMTSAPAPAPAPAPKVAPAPVADPAPKAAQPAPTAPKYAVSGVFDGPIAPPPAPKAPKAPKADPVPSIPTPTPTAPPAQDGEEISLMYLLQHYNKENAAAYKAQKAAKKGAQAPATPATPVAPTAPAAPAAAPKYATSGVFDFDVPGVEKPIAPAAPAAPVQTSAGKFNVVGVFDTPAAPAKGQYKTAGVFDTPTAPKAAPKAPETPVPPAPSAAPAPTPAPAPAPAPMPTGGLDFGGTVMVSAPNMDGTVVLDRPAASASPYLVRVRTQQRVRIDRPLIRIGREKSYADYCIPENPAISHSHANIISRDGKCYVMDTNSRNHTYVNGVMLQSHTETELHDGDKVRFANEDFEFKVF